MTATMNSRSEIRRLAVQNPDALVEEIERLRRQSVELRAEFRRLREASRKADGEISLPVARRYLTMLREEIERLENDCEERDAATVKLFNDNARLREAALKTIADGTAEDPVALAKIAISTSELDFARWCA